MNNLVSKKFKNICIFASGIKDEIEGNVIIVYYINRESNKINMGMQILQEIEYARKMGIGVFFPPDFRKINNNYEISYVPD